MIDSYKTCFDSGAATGIINKKEDRRTEKEKFISHICLNPEYLYYSIGLSLKPLFWFSAAYYLPKKVQYYII